MIKSIISYHQLERISGCGRMKIFPFILALPALKLFGQFNFPIIFSPFAVIYCLQKIRNIYFERNSLIRFAPVPTLVISLYMIWKGIMLLLIALAADSIFLFLLIKIYIDHDNSFIPPEFLCGILFLYLMLLAVWAIGISITTIDNKLFRYGAYILEYTTVSIAIRCIYIISPSTTKYKIPVQSLVYSSFPSLYPLIMGLILAFLFRKSMHIFINKLNSK